MARPEQSSAHIDIRTLPSFPEVQLQPGTQELKKDFLQALDTAGLRDNQLILESLHLASSLHEYNKRTYEPYNNHIIRVALRIIEEFGITDPTIIAAALLHDSLEDHARELSEYLDCKEPIKSSDARILGHQALALYIGVEVADIVLEVSNGLEQFESIDKKNAAYHAKTEHILFNSSLGARAVKLADFIDNAIVAGVENPEKRAQLDKKQLGAYFLHILGMTQPDSLVVNERRPLLVAKLWEGLKRAGERIDKRTA